MRLKMSTDVTVGLVLSTDDQHTSESMWEVQLGRGTIALLDGRADQGATLLRGKAWPQRD